MDYNSFMDSVLFRISLTFLLALLYGIQRQFSNKPIGFGTFIFVSIGSSALALTAMNLDPDTPLPLIGAIVTGIGFLGAGALMKTSDKIYGFTSAASIWLFAIIGLTTGLGYYLIAGTLYSIVWIVVVVDLFFEHRGLGLYRKKLQITSNRAYSKSEMKNIIGAKKYKTLSINFNKNSENFTYSFYVDLTRDELEKLPLDLIKRDDIVSFELA